MLKKKTVTAFALVAIVLCSLIMLLSLLSFLFVRPDNIMIALIINVVAWGFALWASIIGYKLCSKYQLYEDEYKKVGYRIYAIIIAVILFFAAQRVVGIVFVAIFANLWALKKNYDEWGGPEATVKFSFENEGQPETSNPNERDSVGQ